MIIKNQGSYSKGSGDGEAHFDTPGLTLLCPFRANLDQIVPGSCLSSPLAWYLEKCILKAKSLSMSHTGPQTSFPALFRDAQRFGRLSFVMHGQRTSTLHPWQTWLPLPFLCLSPLLKMSRVYSAVLLTPSTGGLGA